MSTSLLVATTLLTNIAVLCFCCTHSGVLIVLQF